MRLSVVIPCYNEEACIEKVVESWIGEIFSKIPDFEMLLVDDGSKDATPDILARLAARHPKLKVIRQPNRGHGPALLNGYRLAGGDWVFHTDSDNQFLPEDFWSLWDLRQRAPYILGVRTGRDDPRHRLILSRALRWGVRLLYGVPVRDINIPYKLIRKDVLEALLPLLPADTLTPSILLAVAAHRRGVPMAQVPVRHLPRTTGQTVLKPWRLSKFCARALWQLLRFGR